MDNLLVDLINSYGTSGNENQIREFIKKYLNNNGHHMYEDKLGNVIVKKGSSKSKIMLCSHMDSAGFIINHIDENGMIKVDSLGEFTTQDVNHSFVRFENGILGKVFCCKSNIFVDVGMNSRDSVSNKLKEGDTASLVGPYLNIGKNNIISPLLHNKVGCYILLKLIEEINIQKPELYFVFSCKGEVGGIGNAEAASDIKPDYAIIVGTENVNMDDKIKRTVNIGRGPVLKLMDKSLIMNEDIKNMLEEASQKSGIRIQYSISKSKSEGGFLHKEISGIRTGEIDVPCRYKYSTSEMVSMDDIDSTIILLKQLISERFS